MQKKLEDFDNDVHQNYDFIQGEFIKEKLHLGGMEAEDVRKNPELVKLLQGKDLKVIFAREMLVGLEGSTQRKYGNTFIKNQDIVNMADYLSSKIGQENFLKICADYGTCLDELGVLVLIDRPEGELTERERKTFDRYSRFFKKVCEEPALIAFTEENVRKVIENEIYRNITNLGAAYFEELPASFKEKYPELFLPENVEKTIKNKFYKGWLTYEDVKKYPYLKDILLTKAVDVGFRLSKNANKSIWENLTTKEILEFAQQYGKYIEDIDGTIFEQCQTADEKQTALQKEIENNILTRKSKYSDTAPEFMKIKHPELFLVDDAPEELKTYFYDGYESQIYDNWNWLSFDEIKKHPEWRKFLKGKELSRAFSESYNELFDRFDCETLLKLGIKYPDTIRRMVQSYKENVLEAWYKATGGRFLPHYIIMQNFPIKEIDSFLANANKWSQLMRMDDYNINDERKSTILKASYSLGLFQGNEESFNKIVELFTGIPSELSEEEYNEIIRKLRQVTNWDSLERPFQEINEEEEFKKAYILWEDEKENCEKSKRKYILKINKQKDKKLAKEIRVILEEADYHKILTYTKAHQIFDGFAMKYDENFVRFFEENIEEIISNPEHIGKIANIQRQFAGITKMNSARKITLEVAEDYIKSIAYDNIDIGNERLAEYAKIAGYSQEDFEKLQKIYNEAEMRDYSSIPKISGKTKGYTYEILRNDDPLTLAIGVLTDCCQKLHGGGETSMVHSALSPDGRVFVVRDEEGRIVAQSWVWRNQYTCCFDNIEVPSRILKLYEKENPEKKKEDLTKGVLEAYKKRSTRFNARRQKGISKIIRKRNNNQRAI